MKFKQNKKITKAIFETGKALGEIKKMRKIIQALHDTESDPVKKEKMKEFLDMTEDMKV